MYHLQTVLGRLSSQIDAELIKDQAGFRTGKSCTGQVLNITQYIKDGYQKELITGVAFVDPSAVYDTVQHRLQRVPLIEENNLPFITSTFSGVRGCFGCLSLALLDTAPVTLLSHSSSVPQMATARFLQNLELVLRLCIILHLPASKTTPSPRFTYRRENICLV